MARGMGSRLSGASKGFSSRRAIPGTKNKVPGAPRGFSEGFRKFKTQLPFQSTSGQFSFMHKKQLRDGQGRFAGGWGMAWQGFEALEEDIDGLALRLVQGGSLREAVEGLAKEMEQWAKDNHPWQNRTGDAERGLQSRVVWSGETEFAIFLGHGKDIHYGVWLEVRWGGRFAILLPTLVHFAPQMSSRIMGAT